jgi:BASS family bile acid:Na+ symporter
MLLQLEKLSVLAFLVSSMGAMGLTMTPRAMLAPLKDLRLVLLALGLNFLFAPGLAWLLTWLIPVRDGHIAGLLLLGGAAGAPFLPKLIQAARGDRAVTAALMGLLNLGTMIFLPFALPLLITGLQIDPWSIARPLLLMMMLPLAIGVVVNTLAPIFASRLAPFLEKVGSVSLLTLSALLLILNARPLLALFGSGAIIITILYFALLFIGSFGMAAVLPRERGTLALATAARNFGAALAPATGSFHDPDVATMIVVGAIVCLAVSFLAARWLRDRSSCVAD